MDGLVLSKFSHAAIVLVITLGRDGYAIGVHSHMTREGGSNHYHFRQTVGPSSEVQTTVDFSV